ncbi:dihydroorotase [Hyphomonas pacifica]|uniref:Dihydroorotase n=1 Tax=Hyphomonas pacifica TaxID=1280941 RepID=A0A062U644_9PROT|nr:dihydroorotase [Hyphomonas pacifica]KCZ51615.1 dihydroorotase [Hyphomonas pacifica]RAN32492.1 dihydroorotase [Hyphomonas pacifica]RAN34284.1 dihydroorotase [Hyphomonas pacifica]
MSLSIYNARLLDPATGLDETGAVLVEDGKITAITPGATGPHTNAEESLDAAGLCLAPGLIDLRVKTGEPGDEQKETLATASRAAVAGGVTSLVVMPDTKPVIDDVALVRFISDRAKTSAKARIYPAGALTTGLKGEAMAEIGLMADAGAVLFTNGDEPLQNASILKRAMTYAASRGAIIMSRPDDRALKGSGVMNGGAFAARKGLAGIPREAEWIGAARDLMLAETTGCTLILDQVSTPRTLELVAKSRAEGANVFTTIAAHTLFFNELDIGDYLTYCKVNPPFRDEDTRLAMIQALKAGEIDAVVSAHDPQPPEEKRLPFGEASFGAAGLETTLAALLSLVHDGPLSLLEALAPITCGPADMIGLPQGRLAEDAPADLILFDPGKPWLCEREYLRSRSTNSPFDGRRLQGRVIQTFISGECVFTR